MSGPFGPAIAAGTLFNYTYPPSVTPPASPSSGDTWQEVDENGKLVEEWERVGSNWLSVDRISSSALVAIAATATINCSTNPSSGAWAFRVEGVLAPSISTDTWNANVRQGVIAANAGVTYNVIQSFNSTAGVLFTFDTGWVVLSDTGWINIPFTRTGTGALNGSVAASRRRVRA